MFLSRLVLNTSSKQARSDLANPYGLHATLCRAFAEEDETPPRFLWRLEQARNSRRSVLLVQSQVEPEWHKLEQRFEGYFQNIETKLIPLEHLQPGQVLRLRLKANPTVTRRDPNNPEKRKRYGLKTIEEQLKWLSRQGQKGGFRVLGAMVAQSERVQMQKHDGGNPITLQSVLYEGHLKTTDLEAFKDTLASGLGHAKALGFGLLSIARG